ncbi:MAG: hypothetical protein ACXVNM_01535 [Bacteroidia bacterium]
MTKNKKIARYQRESALTEGKSQTKPVIDPRERGLLFSFKDFDHTQGQSFSDWQKEGILAQALDTLKNCCSKPLKQQLKTVTIYHDFPLKSDFKHPKHVTPDAQWARIHIDGTQIFAGHIHQGVFYIVFFDKDHSFYKVELKNT